MTIAALIPALNEEKTIGNVIDVLKESNCFFEIIVIDDGSSDKTASIANSKDVRVISQKNAGKGAALRIGAQATGCDTLFFADADLIGLQVAHISLLINSFREKKAAMVIGLRDRYQTITSFVVKYLPLGVLSGERVIGKDFFLHLSEHMPDSGIELVMNAACIRGFLRVEYSHLPGLDQMIKEKKYGFVRGFSARLKMIFQVIRAYISLVIR